jgi:signal recognition particle subunit SRP54
MSQLLGMLPGMSKAMRELKQASLDEGELDRVEAMILSMTAAERARPQLIDGSRRKRIAQGSGTNVAAVKQLIRNFEQMQKLMKRVSQGKMPDVSALMKR